MHLYIGNKCYSSWSLRAWLLLRALDIAFDETVIPLDQPDTRSAIAAISAAGRVPVLVDGDIKVWESLAIAEYLHERHPDKHVWPQATAARAHARAVASEMHAGFSALRAACPMNLGKRFYRRERGSEVAGDVERIEAIWSEARDRFGGNGDGPFLYGAFSAADAMYAPVVTRLDTYDFDVTPQSRSYMDAVLTYPPYRAWRDQALEETWIVPSDEIDEQAAVTLRQHTPS